MSEVYRKGEGDFVVHGTRDVIDYRNGVAFMCPCDFRVVYIDRDIHEIHFDDEGRLTLKPSCGYNASGDPDSPNYRPQNWCHFYIEGGAPRMCGDQSCPGK